MSRPRSALTLVEALAILVVLGLLVALMLPAVRSSGEAARRNSCYNNVKQLALVLHNYHDTHGAFPAASLVDTEGNPLHGWRPSLLPYLEEMSLFESIDFDSAWDALPNEQAGSRCIETFECPSSPQEGGQSNYLAVVGPGFAFPGAEQTTFRDFADGTAQSLLFTEEAVERFVPWIAPEESDEARFLHEAETFSKHPGIHIIAFADGHMKSLSVDAAPEIRRAMLTIAGGEELSDDEL